MRTAVLALAIVALVASPLGSASVPHPQALIVDRLGASTTLLSWTPLAGATGYQVWKGTTHADLHLVESTSATYFVDQESAPDDFYVVVTTSVFGDSAIESSGSSSADCVAMDSHYSVTINADSCIRMSP